MTIMTDQQKHLQQVIEQQQQTINEINILNNQLTTKREIALKLQGVLEYLEQTGVTLPTQEELEAESKVEEKKQEEEESPKPE
jgi:plasmid maintenance system antidote protein VapI